MDRRKKPRVPIRGAVFLVGERVGRGGTVLNVSEEGCAIESSVTLQVGDRLSLHLVLSEDLPSVIVEEARVCWITEDRLGVRFVRLSDRDGERLRTFLRGKLET